MQVYAWESKTAALKQIYITVKHKRPSLRGEKSRCLEKGCLITRSQIHKCLIHGNYRWRELIYKQG
jgi:hypothetical protein